VPYLLLAGAYAATLAAVRSARERRAQRQLA
jgi:hypothetical protein